jgi:hypothetical protein
MGMRQCLGLFAPDLTRDLALTMTDFTPAIAIQSLAWGCAMAADPCSLAARRYTEPARGFAQAPLIERIETG